MNITVSSRWRRFDVETARFFLYVNLSNLWLNLCSRTIPVSLRISQWPTSISPISKSTLIAFTP